jgi:cytochrome c nitrite reductase small subunit
MSCRAVSAKSRGVRSLVSRPEGLLVVLALMFGSLLGVGLFTLGYGEGHAYLSDDPNACANCHIMQPQYDSWLQSSHHAQATCNDCHLPRGFVTRWTAKADNGFFHSWAFTFQDFHEPIQIKERNLRILQANCVACHQTLVTHLQPERVIGGTTTCFTCHHSVGHAARNAGMPRRFPWTDSRDRR